MSRTTKLVKSCCAPLGLALCLVTAAATAQSGAGLEAGPARALVASGETQEVAITPNAHAVVQQVTDQMLAVIQQNIDTLDTEPDQFYADVHEVLDPVVDFGFIARGVMGPFGRRATAEQRQRFADTFKNGLVMTYAKGMAGFGNQDIVVLPPGKDISSHCTVGVEQEVRGADGVNKVSYTMRRKRLQQGDSACGGEWKLVNVVLNGVNLGKTFRSQFAQAMQQERRRNGNDSKIAQHLDSVIDNWSVAN